MTILGVIVLLALIISLGFYAFGKDKPMEDDWFI